VCINGREIKLARSPAGMPFPQSHSRIADGTRRLRRLTREHGPPHIETRKAKVVERDVLREVTRVGERQLLVSRLQGRRAVVLQLECCCERRELREELPFTQIDSCRHAGAPRDTEIGIAMEAQSTFAPRTWDDKRLDEVALNTIEVRRFVMLVDEA